MTKEQINRHRIASFRVDVMRHYSFRSPASSSALKLKAATARPKSGGRAPWAEGQNAEAGARLPRLEEGMLRPKASNVHRPRFRPGDSGTMKAKTAKRLNCFHPMEVGTSKTCSSGVVPKMGIFIKRVCDKHYAQAIEPFRICAQGTNPARRSVRLEAELSGLQRAHGTAPSS